MGDWPRHAGGALPILATGALVAAGLNAMRRAG